MLGPPRPAQLFYLIFIIIGFIPLPQQGNRDISLYFVVSDTVLGASFDLSHIYLNNTGRKLVIIQILQMRKVRFREIA
jgi:hypothetical protein